MNEITANMNWLAVGVGTFVSFILGWLWYSPKLFGAKWAKGVGVELESSAKPSPAPLVMQLIGTFLLAWVIGLTAASSSLITAILVILMVVFLIIANGLFAQKSSVAISIEASFIVAMAVVMIICQGLL